MQRVTYRAQVNWKFRERALEGTPKGLENVDIFIFWADENLRHREGVAFSHYKFHIEALHGVTLKCEIFNLKPGFNLEPNFISSSPPHILPLVAG